MMTTEWKDGDSPGFIAEFTIPNWIANNEVHIKNPDVYAVSDCVRTNGFQPVTAGGKFIVYLGLNPSGKDGPGASFQCQLEGRFEKSHFTVEYHGDRCYAYPPPPPEHFDSCPSATFAWPASGGFWRGTVTIDGMWEPGKQYRVDFGGSATLKITNTYNTVRHAVEVGVAYFWIGDTPDLSLQGGETQLYNQFAFDISDPPHSQPPRILCMMPWPPPPSPPPPPPSVLPPPPSPCPPPPQPPHPPMSPPPPPAPLPPSPPWRDVVDMEGLSTVVMMDSGRDSDDEDDEDSDERIDDGDVTFALPSPSPEPRTRGPPPTPLGHAAVSPSHMQQISPLYVLPVAAAALFMLVRYAWPSAAPAASVVPTEPLDEMLPSARWPPKKKKASTREEKVPLTE